MTGVYDRVPGIVALVLGVLGSALIAYGLTTAAPVVDFATSEEAALKALGVTRVRFGCAVTAMAGSVLLMSSSRLTGAAVIVLSAVVAVVVGADTVVSLALALVLAAVTLVAAVLLVLQGRAR